VTTSHDDQPLSSHVRILIQLGNSCIRIAVDDQPVDHARRGQAELLVQDVERRRAIDKLV